MVDEPTLGEVARRMEAGFTDLKEDFRDLGKRLDGKVSLERYQLEQQARDDMVRAWTERVLAIEAAREKEREQKVIEQREADKRRRDDRRWLQGALIIPLLLVLLQAYLTARGAGS